jgi:hypothetical protein
MPRCGSYLFLLHFTLKQALGSFTKKALQKMHGFNNFGGERGIISTSVRKYSFTQHWSLAQRLEVYYDPNNRCARIGATKQTNLGGYAICLNYSLNENVLIRFEPKFLLATEPILKSNPWDLQFNVGIGIKF